MPLVSVCIPTYKQVDYLKKCLQSVLAQNFTDYELIISDDTPGDEVKDCVFEQLKDKPFIYCKNTPALGSPENWNNAISKATGTYIKVLHHDDFFTQPDSLERMVEAIEKKGTDFLFCATDVWYPATDFHRIHKVTDSRLKKIEADPAYLFFGNWIGAPSATLYRKSVSLPFDKSLVWLVDVDFYIQYLYKHPGLVYLDEPLICTAHETENQVTGQVIHDRTIQVKEPVIVFNKIKRTEAGLKSYRVFFDYLFRAYQVKSYEELVSIVPAAAEQAAFYKSVFSGLQKAVFLKRLKHRLYNSKLNQLFFKSELYG